MSTYLDQLSSILAEKNRPLLDIADRATKTESGLRQQLADANAEIKRMQEAKCPKCGASMPPDGVCQKCLIGKLPRTATEAYKAGVLTFALAVAKCRQSGFVVETAHVVEFVLDFLLENPNEPDKNALMERLIAQIIDTGLYRQPTGKAYDDFYGVIENRL